MSPTCFCKPKVTNCPKCSKPDYSKMRPSNGDGNNGKLVKARIHNVAVMVLAGIVWLGPKLTPADAAAILARCVCGSNADKWPTPEPKGAVTLIPGQPGSMSWMLFPPERPRRELDGTLTDRPIVRSSIRSGRRLSR